MLLGVICDWNVYILLYKEKVTGEKHYTVVGYVVCMYLKLVTKVDDNGVTHWWDIDPLVILEELQSTDLVILEQ